MLTKIKAAWPSPKYDVIAGWDPLFVAMLREGWTVPLRPEEIPVLKEISDVALFRDPKTKEIHAAGMSRAFTGWAYRADKLGEPLTSIKQLFSPKLGKRVCLSDTVSNTGLQLAAFAMTRGGNEHNIDPGFEAAKEFAKTGNVRAVLKADAEFATQLVRGDCWVAFNNMAGFYAASKEHPIKGALKLSDSKTYVYHEGLTVLKTPKAESALTVLGYTTEIDEYMAAADLLVGKPGGLTTSEALAKGLPMVIVNPIPGQEERNADHLLEAGAAIRCNNLPVLAWKIDRLLDEPERLAAMRAQVRRLARPRAAADVVAALLAGLGKPGWPPVGSGP